MMILLFLRLFVSLIMINMLTVNVTHNQMQCYVTALLYLIFNRYVISTFTKKKRSEKALRCKIRYRSSVAHFLGSL